MSRYLLTQISKAKYELNSLGSVSMDMTVATSSSISLLRFAILGFFFRKLYAVVLSKYVIGYVSLETKRREVKIEKNRCC